MSIASIESSERVRGSERVESARRLAWHGALALGVYLFGHGLAFVTQFALARVLGAAAYGVYALVMAWIVAFTYLAMLGQSVALLRFVPLYLTQGRLDQVRGVVQFGERIVATASTLLAVAIAVTIAGLHQRLGTDLSSAFLVGALLIPLIALTTVRCSVVRTFGGVVAALVPLRVVRDLTVFAAVLVIVIAGAGVASATSALIANVAGASLALVVATVSMRALQPAGLELVRPAAEQAAWRAAAWPLLLMTACEAVFDKMSVMVLGFVEGSSRAGILALALAISMLVVLPRTALDTLLAPAIARLHAEDRRIELRATLARASLIAFAAGAGIAVAILAAARPLLDWLGGEFIQGVAALQLLVGAQLIAAASGSQLTIMAMTGREAMAARLLVASTLIALVLSAVLTTTHGLTGAAAGAALAIVGWNALMAHDLWRTQRIVPGIAGAIGARRRQASDAASRLQS